MHKTFPLCLSIALTFGGGLSVNAQTFLAADQDAWPGHILTIRSSVRDSQLFWQRERATSDQLVPKIQSLTLLPNGAVAFCSGLDRSVRALHRDRETEVHFGGSLVRQVRTDTNGDLYWSGLETPLDGNPLPDGFITRKRASTGEVETLLTFSQSLVGRDWWGAFDVREGQVYVATFHDPSRIYVVQNSIPRLIGTLPMAICSFRLESTTTLLALDHHGRLYRFSDFVNDPSRYQLLVERPSRLADFVVSP